MLHLSAALAARGHAIVNGPQDADINVAINDARLLPEGARRPTLWFHNEVSLWREARRGRLPALIRQRPAAIFCGAAQASAASRMLPFSTRTIIRHGVPTAILTAAPAPAPPPPDALFISQAYRGLPDVIGLWRTRIAPRIPAARLLAYIAPAGIAQIRALAAGCPSISILPRIANSDMPARLRTARLVFAPGHRSETFCLAAAEAIAVGVPVVTFGTGALRERVRDGVTGAVCRTGDEMAQSSLALLTDDALWSRMQANGLATRHGAGWDRAAEQWEALLVEPPS